MLTRTLVGVVAGLLVVDVLVGRIDAADEPESEQLLFLRDAELGWTNRPGFENAVQRINAAGMRSPKIPDSAPAEEVRVVACGESNLFGLGLENEQTWAYQLQGLLAGELDPPPRVLNGGVQGYSTIQACRRAARAIEELDPDLLIVLLVPSRQALMDASPALQWTRVGGVRVPSDLVRGWPVSLRFIPARLHTALLHSNLYRRYRTATKFGATAASDVTFFVMSNAEPPQALEGPMRDTRREIERLIAFARERDVELRFALTVETIGTNDRRWQEYLANPKHKGAPPVETPKGEPLDALARWLAPTGARIWDMRDVMFRMGDDWPTYILSKNLHWSEAAHGLVAQDWARRIREEGLLGELAAARRASPRQVSAPPGGADSPAASSKPPGDGGR